MNTVEKLSLEEYKNFLQMMIDSERECSSNGNLQTLTNIQKNNWIEVLNKEMSLEEFESKKI